MNKWRAITAGAFVLAFVAGIPVGWMFDPLEKHHKPEHYAPAWLNDKLELTMAQEDQMREIWSKTARELETMDRSQVSRDKDEQVIAILSDEQKSQYEDIMAEFRERRNEIDTSRREHHHAAIDETKAILSDEQRENFEELLSAQKERGRLPMFGGARSSKGKK